MRLKVMKGNILKDLEQQIRGFIERDRVVVKHIAHMGTFPSYFFYIFWEVNSKDIKPKDKDL